MTTVRSQQKAQGIKSAHPDVSKDKLDFAIVEDISRPDAFDEAVISEPPFEAVIHTASPYHFNVTDTKKDLLDPAVVGTIGILKAIKKSAPTVKRVVITSSVAAILDPNKLVGKKYSEADWCPVTEAEAFESPRNGYRASKTFAEKAAWHFVEKEKPNFTLTSCNPSLVFGPIVHFLNSLDALNTSNQRVRNFMMGAAKEGCPPTNAYFFVDVRDVALSHVLAVENQEAAGKRFVIVADNFCNKQIVEIIGENFPLLRDGLPTGEALKPGDFPAAGKPDIDNRRSVEVLGMTYRSLADSIVDTVKSLQAVEGS